MNESFNKWLKENGLAILADVCAENDIDFDVVTELEDHDLKELGLSLGNRKRLLKAAASLKLPTARNASQDVHPQVASVAETGTVTIEQTERRQVAVLFADLTGFTSLSSKLDPEEL